MGGYLSVEDNGPGAVFSATAEQERVVWTPGQVSNAVGLASHLVLDLGTLSLGRAVKSQVIRRG